MLELKTKPSKSPAKYLQLRDKIIEDIRTGIYKRGSKLPTCRELTSLLGVSYVTANNVLRALEEEGYVKRIHGKGTFITEPAQPKSKIIKAGYFMDVKVSVFAHFFSAVLEEQQGELIYNIPVNMLPNLPYRTLKESEEWLEEALRHHFNSLVIFGDRHFPFKALAKYAEELDQINIVILDNSDIKFPKANKIIVDSKKIGYLAAYHFLKNGHRKLAVLSLRNLDQMYRRGFGISNDDYSNQILDGIEKAYDDFGFNFYDMVRIVPGLESEKADDSERLENDIRKCISDGYTAFYGMGDNRIQLVYELAREFDLKVGRDISAIGTFNTAPCQAMSPALSSISVNEAEIGRITAQAIKENWQGETIIVEPELIVRKSTCKINQDN
jgi:GntR family transcriptional regulator of arabinose operon